MSTERRQCGFSLIELVMFIVIIGIALAGILLVANQTSRHNADTLLRKQALTAAESLLEEIEAHPLAGTSNPVTQTNRPNSHTVYDYNGYSTGASGIMPADGTTTAVPGLSNYTALVTVSSGVLGITPATSAAQITVTVTPPLGAGVVVTGYRTDY